MTESLMLPGKNAVAMKMQRTNQRGKEKREEGGKGEDKFEGK